MSLHLTLFVPGLLGPWPVSRPDALALAVEGLHLEALERLLSRGDRGERRTSRPELSDEPSEIYLARALGLASGPQGEWPLAPISRLADGGAADDGFYLRADPVSARPDLRDVRILDAAAFDLSAEEAAALVGEIRTHFAAGAPPPSVGGGAGGGLPLEAPHPKRWYLRLPGPSRLRARPPSLAPGASLQALLPGGEDAPLWQSFLNEVGMLLHASPVNAARAARGEPPINALWLWGGGRLPPPPAPRWRRVWSEDPLAGALAGFTGTGHAALPAGADEWAARAEPGEHLVVLAELERPARLGDLEAWRAALDSLEKRWFAPLERLLARRGVARMALAPDTRGAVLVSRRALGRWWRRRRPLSGFAPASE